MAKLTNGIVALAALALIVGYFLAVGIIAASIVLWSEQFGVIPSALFGGVGIFTTIIAIELSLVFVFSKPAPLLIVLLIPVIIGYVAITQVASSEAVRKLISEVESRLRTPPFIPLR